MKETIYNNLLKILILQLLEKLMNKKLKSLMQFPLKKMKRRFMFIVVR